MNHQDEVAHFCCEVGQTLIESGAEIGRVESTVEFIAHQAGMKDLQCYAQLGIIFVYYNHGLKNQMIKIKSTQFNFQKVDEINDLSRRYVANEINYQELKNCYQQIRRKVIDFPIWKKILGAGLVAMAPMLVFNTPWINLIIAFWIGIMGYLANYGMAVVTNKPYVSVAAGGLVIGFAASLIHIIFAGTNPEAIIFSALMPLVPGVALTNSFREFMTKNIMSGIFLGIDATVTALVISTSVIIGKLIINWIF